HLAIPARSDDPRRRRRLAGADSRRRPGRADQFYSGVARPRSAMGRHDWNRRQRRRGPNLRRMAGNQGRKTRSRRSLALRIAIEAGFRLLPSESYFVEAARLAGAAAPSPEGCIALGQVTTSERSRFTNSFDFMPT